MRNETLLQQVYFLYLFGGTGDYTRGWNEAIKRAGDVVENYEDDHAVSRNELTETIKEIAPTLALIGGEQKVAEALLVRYDVRKKP